MHITSDNRLKKLIVIGDRLLIKPLRPNEKTESGLYLPPGVQEKKRYSKAMLSKQARDMPFLLPLKKSHGKEKKKK